MTKTNSNLKSKLSRNKLKTKKIAVIMSIYIETTYFELARAFNSLEKQLEIDFDLLLHIDGEIKEKLIDLLKVIHRMEQLKN